MTNAEWIETIKAIPRGPNSWMVLFDRDRLMRLPAIAAELRAAHTALSAADAFIGSLNPYALEDRSLGPLEQYKAAAEAWGKASQK